MVICKKTLFNCLITSFVCGTAVLRANTFNYTAGDVLIGFRKAGAGTTDLVVDAGSVTNFVNQAPNTTVTISAYTGQQLGVVGTNNIAWCAFAYITGTSNTLYVSNPRADVNTQTTPYTTDRSSAQGQVTSQMGAIVNGAKIQQNYNGLNSSTAVLEPESYVVSGVGASYYNGLWNDASGSFNSTFQAQPEGYTAVNFTTAGVPSRADFYYLPPNAAAVNGTFLGYFQLNTNGVMTYTAYPAVSVVAPVITAYSHIGTTNTLTFTTGSSGTYTLRGTNSAGLTTARTNWPAISSVAGDGASHQLSDVSSNSGKFYTITAQ
jgi:hypothetical protein